MNHSNRAEPPTILSDQIQAAICSYVPTPAGPTLANHIARELVNWLTTQTGISAAASAGTELQASPVDAETLDAAATDRKEFSAPFAGLAAKASAAKEFEWNKPWNLVAGGGKVYAQIMELRLQIFDTGESLLQVKLRTFAKIRYRIDVHLAQRNSGSLCTVSTNTQTLESTGGMPLWFSFASINPCVGQFFSIINAATRETWGQGPL